MKKSKKKIAVSNPGEWLEAIHHMRAYYEFKTELHQIFQGSSFGCLFCRISEQSCDKCLWMLFDGVRCDVYANKKFHSSVGLLRDLRPRDWVEDSLKRLSRWEARLKEGAP